MTLLEPIEFRIDADVLAGWYRNGNRLPVPLPESWRDQLPFGAVYFIDWTRDGTFGVAIYVRGREKPTQDFIISWGDGPTQHRKLKFGRDPNSGRHYLASSFRTRLSENGFMLKICAI